LSRSDFFSASSLLLCISTPSRRSKEGTLTMLLTDHVDVFITKRNCRNTFLSEYTTLQDIIPNERQCYTAVCDGDEYSVSVVFGQEFEISPAQNDAQLGHKVSACRIKVRLDEGIAMEERVFTMNDVTPRPKVHDFHTFSSASVTDGGEIKRYRPHIELLREGESCFLLQRVYNHEVISRQKVLIASPCPKK
jgi:hypothetical protein